MRNPMVVNSPRALVYFAIFFQGRDLILPRGKRRIIEAPRPNAYLPIENARASIPNGERFVRIMYAGLFVWIKVLMFGSSGLVTRTTLLKFGNDSFGPTGFDLKEFPMLGFDSVGGKLNRSYWWITRRIESECSVATAAKTDRKWSLLSNLSASDFELFA